MDPTIRYRFLGVPSSASSTSSTDALGDELNEDDILWTSDYPTTEDNITAASRPSNRGGSPGGGQRNSGRGSSFPKNSGILAVLPESNRQPVLRRKTSIPSATTTAIPMLPRPLPEREYSASLPAAGRKMNHSAPMNVPVLSIAIAKQRNSRFKDEDDDIDGDEEMLPPHEIVARGSMHSPKTTFSVLEGVGRTLKGRDLRRVRNAVFHQTGFID